jgi:hypothetical protein
MFDPESPKGDRDSHLRDLLICLGCRLFSSSTVRREGPATAIYPLRRLHDEVTMPPQAEREGQQKDSEYQSIRADPQHNGERTSARGE